MTKDKILTWTKRIAITLVAIVFLLAAAIGFVFEFVLSSDKITPRVVEAINKNLKGELALEGVELTFFKTFPNFKLELQEGVLLPVNRKDTLVSFDRALVSVNPIAFLNNRIKVNRFLFENPKFFAFVDTDGEANWDILKTPDSLAMAQADSIASAEKEAQSDEDEGQFEASVVLENIEVVNGEMIFDDRYGGNYFETKGFDLQLAALYAAEKIEMELETDTEDIVFRKGDQTFTDKISLAVVADMEFDRLEKKLNMEEAKVSLNELDFLLEGYLKPDREEKVIDTDLRLALEIPTLNTLIELIPPAYLDKSVGYTAKGSAEIEAHIRGQYKKNQWPDIKARLAINDGALSFNGKQNQIEALEGDVTLNLPSNRGKNSSLDIHQLSVKGAGTDLSIKGSGKDLFGAGLMDLDFKGSLDLNGMKKALPLKKELRVEGSSTGRLEANFRLRDWKKGDYGRIQALGELKAKDIRLMSPKDSLKLSIDRLDLLTGKQNNSQLLVAEGSEVIGGRVQLDSLRIEHKNQSEVRMDKFDAKFSSTPLQDSTRIATLRSSIHLENALFVLGDSLKGRVDYLKGELQIDPLADQPLVPVVRSNFKADSLGVKVKGKFVVLEGAQYNLSSVRQNRNWPLSGEIEFKHLEAFLPRFPLPLVMPRTKISLEPGLVELDEAHLEIGDSDLTATGRVYNLGDAFLENKMFKGELEIVSETMDINQIIGALNEGKKVAEQSETAVDTVKTQSTASSTGTQSFIVPANLDLRFESHLKTVKYRNLEIEDVRGLIEVRDQKVSMSNLGMTTMAAKMATSITYAADEEKAQLDFDFKLSEIDLAQLTALFPIIDSLLPMADSFEGKVNFRMKGASSLSEDMGMMAKSLNAMARVEGNDLVVLDGKTFQKISKILLFKNKEKNTIDKMEFAMIFRDETIEVFPSLLTVDRYKVALGGKHHLDMSYDYHLSVLKSPVPFKTGIDIRGNEDDLDFKITKAKYKFMFSDKEKQRKKADTVLINRKKWVIESLPF